MDYYKQRNENIEKAEAMDMSDEEAARVQGPSAASGLPLDVCAVEAGFDRTARTQEQDPLRPGPSNVASGSASIADDAPCNAKLEINDGSDFDSDYYYGDEFTENDLELTAFGTELRDLPTEDNELLNEVQNAMDEAIERVSGLSSEYVWVSNFDTFRGRRKSFSGPAPGCVSPYGTGYDAFTDIWGKDIVGVIAEETNRYAGQMIEDLTAKGELTESSRLQQWRDTDVDELYVLFAISMYMGILRLDTQKEYWMKGVLELPNFRKIMSYNRYVLLWKCLHFIDNKTSSKYSTPSSELMKLGPVVAHLNTKFSSLYNLRSDISIGESLIFKGMRSKAAGIAMKSHELCESSTGYVSRFEIYSDETASLSAELGESAKVLALLKGLERRGHCVTVDDVHNCPALARYLSSEGFDCVGTLRANCKNVPRDIAGMSKNAARGTTVARHCGDVSVLAWKHSRVVTMMSTYHDDTCLGSEAGRAILTPVSVSYSHRDQKLSFERNRGSKWYVNIFKRLLDVSVYNAYVMYGDSVRRHNRPGTPREFRYELAAALLHHHRQQVEEVRAQMHLEPRLRMDIHHFPAFAKGAGNRRRCVVCYRRGKQKVVHSSCEACATHLCVGDCWRQWHTLAGIKTQARPSRKRKRDDA